MSYWSIPVPLLVPCKWDSLFFSLVAGQQEHSWREEPCTAEWGDHAIHLKAAGCCAFFARPWDRLNPIFFLHLFFQILEDPYCSQFFKYHVMLFMSCASLVVQALIWLCSFKTLEKFSLIEVLHWKLFRYCTLVKSETWLLLRVCYFGKQILVLFGT